MKDLFLPALQFGLRNGKADSESETFTQFKKRDSE
jgi:hypothetical protein